MKKIAFLVSLCLCIYSFAQTPDDTAVRQWVENIYEEIYSELEESKIPDYFTADFKGFADGREINTDSLHLIVQRLEETFHSEENKNLNLKRENRIDIKSIQYFDSQIFVRYKNTARFILGGNAFLNREWMELAEFTQTPEGWKISYLITSPFSHDSKNNREFE